MAYYDVDQGAPRRYKSQRYERDRDDREPRYVETETFIRGPANDPRAPEPAYENRRTELVRRPVREDSDLSIEEVRRDFPPPGSGYAASRSMGRGDRYGYGPPRRARSADRNSQYDDEWHDDRDRRGRNNLVVEEKSGPRRRSLSRNQKIIAAVSGAALAVGGKELWDRRQASRDGTPKPRNALGTAAVGAAGAFAAFEGAELYAKHNGDIKKKVKHYAAYEGKDGPAEVYYSSDEESVQPKRSKSKRKSLIEGALGLAGAGAAAKALGGGNDRGRDDRRSGRSRRDDSYDSYDSRYDRRERSRGGRKEDGPAKFQQAAKAALLAGATEAFRVRNEPGGWGGEKGKRILTAAIGAGGIDAAADRNPDRKSKRHILEAVVGGLAGNRLINGSRNEVDDRDRDRRTRSKSRARSQSKGPGGGNGLAALATAGLGALAGKKLLDRSRSRSRSRSVSRSRGGGRRSRRYDSYSDDSRSPSPRREKRSRSKSVTAFARKGLAAIGIGEGASALDDKKGGSREIEETHIVHRRRRPDDRYGDDPDYAQTRGGPQGYGPDPGYAAPYGDPRNADSRSSVGSRRTGKSGRRREGGRNKAIAEGRKSATSSSDSSSDIGSSSGDEKERKKMKGKQFLTAGLATIATIHAAHGVYQSYEKRQARQKAVKEGEISRAEAKKLKTKALIQDAASVGIAALGIKGAVGEWKEMQEMRKECIEFEEKKEERHKKRLERLSKNNGSGNRYKRRTDDWNNSVPGGPQYLDANPYSAGLPAPPVGYDDRRY